jgi:anti-sigma factor RsiW
MSMADLAREVAGITCREVLASLSDFVDGNLSDAEVAAVHGHLAGCRNCEAFGGRFTGVLAALRATLDEEAAGEAKALDRLNARLARELP